MRRNYAVVHHAVLKFIAVILLMPVLAGFAEVDDPDDSSDVEITLYEARILLSEAIPKMADGIAERVLALGDQIRVVSTPSKGLCSFGAGSPDIVFEGKSGLRANIRRAIDRIMSEPNAETLVDVLLRLSDSELSAIIVESGFRPFIKRRLSGLAIDNRELAGRFIDLLYERRSVLEIAARSDLQVPITEFLGLLSDRELVVGYFGGFAGTSIANDVFATVLEILPMSSRLEVLGAIDESQELSHVRARLECLLGLGGMPISRLLELPKSWIKGQIEKGYYWWLKELIGYVDDVNIVDSDERLVIGRRGYGEEADLVYAHEHLSALDERAQLEIIAVNGNAIFLDIVDPIYQELLDVVKYSGDALHSEQEHLLSLLMTVLVKMNTHVSMHMLDELAQHLETVNQKDLLMFLSDLLQTNVTDLVRFDLVVSLLANHPEVEISNIHVLKHFEEITPNHRVSVLAPRINGWLDTVRRSVDSIDEIARYDWNLCLSLAGLLASYGHTIFNDWEGAYRELLQTSRGRGILESCNDTLVRAAVIDDEGRGVLGLLSMWDDSNSGSRYYSELVGLAIISDGNGESVRRNAMLDFVRDREIWNELPSETQRKLEGGELQQ